MPSKSENMEIIRWLKQYIDQAVDSKLRSMGIPLFCVPGVVQSVSTTGGNTFASVYLNGSSTASPNIPVNPDIAANIAANTPVWVVRVNFNTLDMFVAWRKMA